MEDTNITSSTGRGDHSRHSPHHGRAHGRAHGPASSSARAPGCSSVNNSLEEAAQRTQEAGEVEAREVRRLEAGAKTEEEAEQLKIFLFSMYFFDFIQILDSRCG